MVCPDTDATVAKPVIAALQTITMSLALNTSMPPAWPPPGSRNRPTRCLQPPDRDKSSEGGGELGRVPGQRRAERDAMTVRTQAPGFARTPIHRWRGDRGSPSRRRPGIFLHAVLPFVGAVAALVRLEHRDRGTEHDQGPAPSRSSVRSGRNRRPAGTLHVDAPAAHIRASVTMVRADPPWSAPARESSHSTVITQALGHPRWCRRWWLSGMLACRDVIQLSTSLPASVAPLVTAHRLPPVL